VGAERLREIMTDPVLQADQPRPVARIGAGSLIAAGAVVPQGVVVPARSLVTGVPGRVRRELS
jgi:hypothetical protein